MIDFCVLVNEYFASQLEDLNYKYVSASLVELFACQFKHTNQVYRQEASAMIIAGGTKAKNGFKAWCSDINIKVWFLAGFAVSHNFLFLGWV